MKSFQGRNKIRQFLYSKVSLFVLMLLIVGLSKGVWGIYSKAKLARENFQASVIQLTELEMREKDLEEKVTKIKTPRGVEEEIRKNFSVVKEGERVITIVDNTGSPTTSQEVKKRGLIMRILGW